MTVCVVYARPYSTSLRTCFGYYPITLHVGLVQGDLLYLEVYPAHSRKINSQPSRNLQE